MLKTSIFGSLLLLSSYAVAFYDTVPLTVWSSSSSAFRSLKDRIPEVPSQTQVINALTDNDEFCSMGSVVVISQPGLHANHLSSLSSDSYLKSRVQDSGSTAHFPFVTTASSMDAASIARAVAELCHSVQMEWPTAKSLDPAQKYALHFELPEVVGKLWSTHDQTLERNLAQITSTLNSYIVILTGTTHSDATLILKRQQSNSLSAADFRSRPNHAIAPFANVTAPTGGILARYQLLTPGLLTSLLIAFGLLIPLLMVGIRALASIQNPIRTEAPKGPSLEKKNQ